MRITALAFDCRWMRRKDGWTVGALASIGVAGGKPGLTMPSVFHEGPQSGHSYKGDLIAVLPGHSSKTTNVHRKCFGLSDAEVHREAERTMQ
jgi:hypothetical protein